MASRISRTVSRRLPCFRLTNVASQQHRGDTCGGAIPEAVLLGEAGRVAIGAEDGVPERAGAVVVRVDASLMMQRMRFGPHQDPPEKARRAHVHVLEDSGREA